MSREHRWLLGTLLIALAARALWSWYSPCLPFVDYSIYHGHAVHLSQGLGYVRGDGVPTAYWPVGYPLFLAGLYTAFGPSLAVAKTANVLLGVLTVLLTYALARQIHHTVALLASGVLAIWPSSVALSSVLASENLFTPLLLSSLILLVSAYRPPARLARLFAAGIFAGAAGLVRPVGLLVLPLAAFWWLLYRPGERAPQRLLLCLGVLCSGALVALAPWIVRNALVMNSFVLVSTNGGPNLAVGNNPQASGRYVDPPQDIRNLHGDEVQRNRAAYRYAVRYITHHPLRFLGLGLRKIYYLYSRDTAALGWMQFTETSRPVSRWERYVLAGVGQLFYSVALVLAVLGAIRADRSNPGVGLLLALIGFWTAFHFVYFGEDRFHAPLVPAFAILAGIYLQSIPALTRAIGSGGRESSHTTDDVDQVRALS